MMTKSIKIFFLIATGIFLLPSMVIAQQLTKEEVNLKLEEGYKLMQLGQNEQADKIFRTILDQAPSLPPDICYYFGVNSFQLGKYKQSINWLNKYLELKGTNGQYFESCEEYLDLAELAYQKDQNKADDVEAIEPDYLTTEKEPTPLPEGVDRIIDCEKYGKIICPVCKGKGVIVKEGLFGKEFNTCPYGDDYGYMSCEDYNLLLQGKLEPKDRL